MRKNQWDATVHMLLCRVIEVRQFCNVLPHQAAPFEKNVTENVTNKSGIAYGIAFNDFES